jgi:hypothetical protein
MVERPSGMVLETLGGRRCRLPDDPAECAYKRLLAQTVARR